MDTTANNTIFNDGSQVKVIINALNYYLALLLNDLPYLSGEDQAGLQEEITIIEKVMNKMEESYPGLYD